MMRYAVAFCLEHLGSARVLTVAAGLLGRGLLALRDTHLTDLCTFTGLVTAKRPSIDLSERRVFAAVHAVRMR